MTFALGQRLPMGSQWLMVAVAVLTILLFVAWGLLATEWLWDASKPSLAPERFATTITLTKSIPASPTLAKKQIIDPYPDTLYSLYTETDEALRNQHQTTLTTGVLTLILENTYVMRNYKLPLSKIPARIRKIGAIAKALTTTVVPRSQYKVNPITSPLLDCTDLKNWGRFVWNDTYNTGCPGGRITTHLSSCRCSYPFLSSDYVEEPELFLLGSQHQDPSLALFINIVNRLSSKYPVSDKLFTFRNQCMEDYYEYRQHTNKKDAFDTNAEEKADILALSAQQKLLMPLTKTSFDSDMEELVSKMGLNKGTAQTQNKALDRQLFDVRYDLDRASGVLNTNRAMLMPLTQVQNTENYNPTNLYPEHDGVYSVGPTSDDLSFELSVAAKHLTTVTRLNYNASGSLSEALANNQYSGRNAAADKQFMRHWFVAFCMMAPYMVSDDAKEGPSIAEMQFTIRQLVRAMSESSRRDLPTTNEDGTVDKTNYDYAQTMHLVPPGDITQYKPDDERKQSVMAVADAALYGKVTANTLKQTEWPLTMMAGTSANDQKRLTVRIPWAIHVFGVVVSSTPAIVRKYDLALKAVPSTQYTNMVSVGRNKTPVPWSLRGWTVEVTITKRTRDGRYGWDEAFPLYFGKNVRVLKTDSLTFPQALFRGYIDTAGTLDVSVTNGLALPPTNLTFYPPVRTRLVKGKKTPVIVSGVSDIGMPDWYPHYPSYTKTTTQVGMQQSQPNQPQPASETNNVQTNGMLSEDINTTCVRPPSQTISMGNNPPCVVNTFDRSLFNHRNALLVLEPDGTERGLGSFFDWLLDRDASKCAQAEKDNLYQQHPQADPFAERFAEMQQPSTVERNDIAKSTIYDQKMKTRAGQAVHLQQLTQAVKTLVIRLDEFDGDAFRTLAPSPSDTEWLNATETNATPEMFAAAESARDNYPKHIATLFRMHEALRILLMNYVIVGIVSPCVISDNVRSFKTPAMPLTDADIFLYQTKSYGKNPYPPAPRKGESAEEATAETEPDLQYTTYASLVLTLRRKADLPKGMYTGVANQLRTVLPLTNNPQMPSYFDLIDPYMLHTIENMRLATWKPSSVQYKQMVATQETVLEEVEEAREKDKKEAKKEAEEQREQAEKQQEEEVKRLQKQIERQEAVRKAHMSMHEGAGNA